VSKSYQLGVIERSSNAQIAPKTTLPSRVGKTLSRSKPKSAGNALCIPRRLARRALRASPAGRCLSSWRWTLPDRPLPDHPAAEPESARAALEELSDAKAWVTPSHQTTMRPIDGCSVRAVKSDHGSASPHYRHGPCLLLDRSARDRPDPRLRANSRPRSVDRLWRGTGG
jgi:hypothetical protein